MKYLVTLLVLLTSSVLWADSTANYRSTFINKCTDGDSDEINHKMCTCVYDTWQQQIDSQSSKGAIIAAQLSAEANKEFYPSELQTAAPYLQKFSEASSLCADKVIGKINMSDSSAYTPSNTDQDDSYTQNLPNESKKGLLGAVAGWAGNKVGLPSQINDVVKDKADNYEPKLTDKLNPLKSKFNPFRNKKKPKDTEALEITDRTVASYKTDFEKHCGKLATQICDCRWQALQSTIKGKDNAEARVLAYMASGPAGDLPIPTDVSINRQQLFKKFDDYTQQIASCE